MDYYASLNGYEVKVACPFGVTFERWVLPWDAVEDLLVEPFQAVRRWLEEGT